MTNVTDRQQNEWDPWVDHPDPGPEDFARDLAATKPEDWECFPGDTSSRVIVLPNDGDVNDWIKRRDAAHARGEHLPEEIRADELAEAELARRARETLEQDQH